MAPALRRKVRRLFRTSSQLTGQLESGSPDACTGRQFSFVVSVNFFFAVHRPFPHRFSSTFPRRILHLVKCGPPLPRRKFREPRLTRTYITLGSGTWDLPASLYPIFGQHFPPFAATPALHFPAIFVLAKNAFSSSSLQPPTKGEYFKARARLSCNPSRIPSTLPHSCISASASALASTEALALASASHVFWSLD